MEPSSLTDYSSNHPTEPGISSFSDDQPPSSSGQWDWSDTLDFSILYDDDSERDHFPVPPNMSPMGVDFSPGPVLYEPADRVRKRDPRLTCSNFIAGRVPCACPELDEKLQEEGGTPDKKRARVAPPARSVVRCQVFGCEADISQLKGYHKRHRVCLRCANACSVVLDGETKRYCQQCGKFHVLQDFDEGRRSCRRKLERHNNRRRRKPHDGKCALDKGHKEYQNVVTTASDDLILENSSLSSQVVYNEIAVAEPVRGKVGQSCPSFVNSDSGVSVVASGDTLNDDGRVDSKLPFSSPCYENKAAYSSTCPTGRISFKLYDWNPAEFPRTLRLQILEWLACMPIELEGYIRPGCTILTAFIAMPTSMWGTLLDNPISYIHDLVTVPGKMLSGKTPMLIYLNNTIYQKDENFLTNVEVKEQAPRLHYVYPTCFEAGRPMEFIACGSNLMQQKIQFLVSFGGRYLKYDSCIAVPCGDSEGKSSGDHQTYRICIPFTEPHHFGPAFIEVENVSGLSNFYPILISDRDVCYEMKTIQEAFYAPSRPNSSNCEMIASSQMEFSELLLDIAWLLKKPSVRAIEQAMTFTNIERITTLVSYLQYHGSIFILDQILQNLEVSMQEMVHNYTHNQTSNLEFQSLRTHVECSRNILNMTVKKRKDVVLHSRVNISPRNNVAECSVDESLVSVVSVSDLVTTEKSFTRLTSGSSLMRNSPFMVGKAVGDLGGRRHSRSLPFRFFNSRMTMLMICTLAVCFGVCAVIFHPEKVSQLAVTIHSCMTHRISY